MEAEVLPADATNKRVTWSVENGTGEATISSGGLLSAVADGTVTVVATSFNGLVQGELVITISATRIPWCRLRKLPFTGAGGATTIEVVNGTLQMEAEVLPANATDRSVTWSVNNGTGQATISASGLLTAVDDGTVTVIATSADGLVSGELVITISNQNPVVPVTDIIVTGAGGATTIEVVNGTLQMEAEVLPAEATNKTVTWSVTNGTGQASISGSGLLTAVADGTVTVIATSADGQVSGELVITISNQNPVVPVTDITVTGAGGATTIEVDNGTLQMEAEVLPENATNKAVTWSVDNGTGEAAISSGGLLTAARNGTVNAVATSADGLTSGDVEITITNQSTTGINDPENGPEILVYGKAIS